MARLQLVILLSVGLGMLAGPAAAGKRAKGKKQKPKKTVVIVLEKGASKEIVAAVEEFCVKAESFYGVGVWKKKRLKKRVGKCADAACLAKLGKKKKQTTLVVGRAHPTDGDGVRFAFQVIDIETKEAIASSELTVSSAEQAQAEIARAYFGIVGITTPGYVAIADAPPAVNVDGSDVEVKDGKLELPPGPHTLTVNDEEQDVMVLPNETRDVTFASLAPPPSEPETPLDFGAEPTEVADASSEDASAADTSEASDASAADTSDTSTVASDDELTGVLVEDPVVSETVEPSSPGLGLLSWVGIGTAGTGAIVLGVGGFFGSQTTVELESGTTQLEAHQLNDDARSKATMANALMIGGGVLVVAGASMLALDLLSEPSVAVSAAPVADGAAIFVGGRW